MQVMPVDCDHGLIAAPHPHLARCSAGNAYLLRLEVDVAPQRGPHCQHTTQMFKFPSFLRNFLSREGHEDSRHRLLLLIADVGWFLLILAALVSLYCSLQSYPDMSKAAVFAVLGIALAAALVAAGIEAWRLQRGYRDEWRESLAPLQNYLAVVVLAAVLIPLYDRRWAGQLRTTILKTSVERQVSRGRVSMQAVTFCIDNGFPLTTGSHFYAVSRRHVAQH